MTVHGNADVVAAVQAYLQYLRRLGVTELAVTLPQRRTATAPARLASARSSDASQRVVAPETAPVVPVSERLVPELPSSRSLPVLELPSVPQGVASSSGDAVAEPQAPALVPATVVTSDAVAGLPDALSAGITATERLRQLAEMVRDCQQCRLHQGRKQVVFGSGDPAAALVFVGEAPGRDEDLQGEPFVGQAGQLLTRIIEAIGLKREQVYILNVIKCRPPNNRDPFPDEIAACQPIVQAQLACLQPKVICTLGSFATRALLQTEERISHLRGRFHSIGALQVMPTYHPAFLLRNPQYKRAVWEDMQKIQRILALPAGVATAKR